MARSANERSPAVDGSTVTFRLPDPSARLTSVRLVQEIGLQDPLELSRSRGLWSLRLPLPGVDRMEYLFEIEDHNGHRSTITDPGNSHRVGGAFGEKSELRFRGYREPEWLHWPEGDDTVTQAKLPARQIRGGGVAVTLWTPRSLESRQPAPLVVVHDGPEYASLGSLTRYLSAAVRAEALPPCRAALLGPGDRNSWYSANPAYARALCRTVLPALDDMAPSTFRVGVGVSLGGLAMLHAHRSFPGRFDAMLLQSASFFTPALDPQESGFSGFPDVTRFVGGVHASASDDHPVPVVLTCGTAEENLANNRRMATTLLRLGYPLRLVTIRDAHNYTAWRDALHPYFAALVSDVVAERAA